MENLPLEILQLIFKDLNLFDRLKFRLMNKKFKFLIDHYLMRKNLFIASEQYNYFNCQKWFFYNDHLIDNHNYKDANCLILNRMLNDKFFNYSNIIFRSQIKDLVIYMISEKKLIKILECLKYIERLSLNYLGDECSECLTINLKRLKILELNYCTKKEIKFILPKLNKLSIEDIFRLSYYQFHYPETIEYCNIDEFNRIITKFYNLKVLFCFETDNRFSQNIIKSDLLCKFKKLEQLHLNDSNVYSIMEKQKIKFNLNRLKIYLYGLNIDNSIDYNGLTSNLDERKIRLYIENNSKSNLAYSIPDNDFKINYNNYFESFSYLPDNLFKKFKRYHSISASFSNENQNSIDRFIEFTKQYGRINNLIFNLETYSYDLFNKLSSINNVLYLTTLEINLKNHHSLNEQNLEILFNFINLEELKFIDNSINSDLYKFQSMSISCFKNFKKLTKLIWYIKNKRRELKLTKILNQIMLTNTTPNNESSKYFDDIDSIRLLLNNFQ